MDVLYLSVILVIFCFPIEGIKPKIGNALVYLSQYGYLEPNAMGNSSLLNGKTFKKSIEEFQSFAGIPVTGKLDKSTMKMMSLPRCGMKDTTGRSKRQKRYAIQGSRWKTKKLTFKISKYSSKLGRGEIDRTIQKAFNLWSKYTDLTFEPSSRGKIDIRFEEGQHGDGDAFDGPSGTLAHAYFPQYGGATHFDESEPWRIGAGSGIDLYQVATHEFGHALGLSHSDTKDALMAPFYKRSWTNDLYADDIRGIQKLYGAKSSEGPATPPEEPATPPEQPATPRRNRPTYPGGWFFPRRRWVFRRRWNFPQGGPRVFLGWN